MKTIVKANYYYYSFLFLALSMSAYAVKITEFSPVYVIYITLLPLFFLILFESNRISKISEDIRLIFLLLIFVLVFHFVHLNNGASVNLVISLMGYIYLRLSKYKISLKQYSTVINFMVVFNLLILGLDTIYRVMNPTHPTFEKINEYSGSDKWFYLYKFNSLMFSDSNDTALVLIVLLFTVLLIPAHFFYFSKIKIYIVIVFLILLTFSRAAYIVTILGFLKYKIESFRGVNKFLIRFSLIILVIISIPIIFSFLILDDSFMVRLDIITKTMDLLSYTSYTDLLIGVGPGQGEKVLGIYTHIFYLTYILELGIIGLLLVLTFFYIYIYKYGSIVLFPVLTIGLSFFLYLGTPFLFIPLALLANIYDVQNYNFKYLKIDQKICVE